MDAPPFMLEIDKDTQLATVRPREGSFILIESVSPSEVVLRLRQPPDSHASLASAAAPPAAAPPPTPTSLPPDTPNSAAAEPEADRQSDDGSDNEDIQRAASSITAEQLTAAQLAVQRAIRGLTGPEAARVLDADKDGHPGHTSAPLTRAASREAPPNSPHYVSDGYTPDAESLAAYNGGGHRWLSPGSTPSSSPRNSMRTMSETRQHRGSSSRSWHDSQEADGSMRRRSGHAPLRRGSSSLAGQGRQRERAERDGLGGGYGQPFRPRHSGGAVDADWRSHGSQHSPMGASYRQQPPPPPPARRRTPPPPVRDARTRPDERMPAARQASLPSAVVGSPSNMLFKVKRGMDGEVAALQQAQVLLQQKRALRNGTLAAARPVTHEAFEFWHEQADGGCGLESYNSRESAAAFGELPAIDEAAQAVAQWSALRSTPSPTQHDSASGFEAQHMQPGLQQQQQLHQQQQHGQQQQQPSQQLPTSSLLSHEPLALWGNSQQQYGLAARQQQSAFRSLKQDSWPPPPTEPGPHFGAEAHAMHAGAPAMLQLPVGSATCAVQRRESAMHRPTSSADSAAHLPPSRFADQQLPASTLRHEAAASPARTPDASGGSMLQGSVGWQPDSKYDLTWQNSEPGVSSQSFGSSLSRFSNMQQQLRALSDDPIRSASKQVAQPSNNMPSTDAARGSSPSNFSRTPGPPSPSHPNPRPPSPQANFAGSLADQVFQASKAWSLSSADAEALGKVRLPATSSAEQMPFTNLAGSMFRFLDDDH